MFYYDYDGLLEFLMAGTGGWVALACFEGWAGMQSHYGIIFPLSFNSSGGIIDV